MSVSSVPDFDKLFQRKNSSAAAAANTVKIPGIDMDDSSHSSSSSSSEPSSPVNSSSNKRNAGSADEEYIPQALTDSPPSVPQPYIPQGLKSPTPPVVNERPKPKRRNSVAVVKRVKFDLPPPPPPSTPQGPLSKRQKREAAASQPTIVPPMVKPGMLSAPPPPSPSTSQQNSLPVEIRDNMIFLTRLHKKNSFEINLQVPIKYYKNVMPIFHKNVRLELFVQREKSDNLWSSVSVKNSDSIKTPLPIFKIVNVDDAVVDNLRLVLNNSFDNSPANKEPKLNEKSDKNYKIYNESNVVRIGAGNDQSIYSNARIELKKNITYVFRLSLNVIFARFYVNVQAEHYRCTICSRDDNNFLACLVITPSDNCTIENGVKLMHNIRSSN